MAGFEFRYRKSGGSPTIQKIVTTPTSWKKGDMAHLNASSRADIGTSGSATFLGVVCADYSGLTAGTDKVDVVVDDDAVYSAADTSARLIGATLDITGMTGAQGVTASSNKEFVVVATKDNSSDPVLVQFNTGKHLFNVAR